jgi:HEAT repeat protein
MPRPISPRPFGSERIERLPLAEVVEALGIEHLSRAAFWRLVAVGTEATAAVQRGLTSDDAAVRRGCCEFLDLFFDDEAADEMLRLLADPDAEVRRMAAHALTCERCKKETWATRPH